MGTSDQALSVKITTRSVHFQAMAPIEVYGMSLSAPCRIVNMTAECLGLEYEFKVVDLMAGEHMKPEFLAMNPQHNIPTVKDGDFVMNESRAVAGYLAKAL